MLFTHAFPIVIALVVSTIVISVAARMARSAVRRRFDLGVVSERWLLSHRAED